MNQKTNRKQKKSELKSALLNEGGQADGSDNQMMQDLKSRMQGAHRRMSLANQQNKGINLGALNPMKGLQKAQEQGGKMAECMTPHRIFLVYGILDIIIFVTIIALLIAYKNPFVMFMGLILIYFPNVVLFIAILTADSVTTRGLYQKWLRFKLIFMGFMLPLIALHQSESRWESAICSQQLQQYNVDMTQEEMQNIIDSKDFSLLLSTEGKQLGEYKQQSKITDGPISGEFSLADVGKKAARGLSKLTVMVDDTKELTPAELQLRYIQFCGTSVVLGSLLVIVVYQMFQGHQYFVARGRHLEVLNIDENVSKRVNKLNVILGDKMAKFEAGDAHFLLKELQAAADALNTQVEFKRQNSVSYSEPPETGTQGGFSTAIN